MLAFYLIAKYRREHNLNCTIVNQIHDAILFNVPREELDDTKEMIYATMGNIEIPTLPDTLILGVDIDVMERWGEK